MIKEGKTLDEIKKAFGVADSAGGRGRPPLAEPGRGHLPGIDRKEMNGARAPRGHFFASAGGAGVSLNFSVTSFSWAARRSRNFTSSSHLNRAR